MDAEARQRRLVAVVRRLVERGNPNGFVILIEDLHWVDAASDAFVAETSTRSTTGPREKQVLQRAAVIGKQFTESILAAVVELPAAELASSLSALCNAEFIHQESLYPIAEYAFAHPLTQEVALGSQLHEQRRKAHAAVAQAIRDAEPARLDENSALLAHHYDEAGEVMEAARFHARCATWVGTKDLDGTLRHWQRVRDLVRALPDSHEANVLHLLACQRILNVGGFRLGLSEAAVDELYEEGSKLAVAAGNAALLVHLRMAYSGRLVGLGRVREYHDLTTQNLKSGDESGVAEIRAGVRIGVAYALYQQGGRLQLPDLVRRDSRHAGGYDGEARRRTPPVCGDGRRWTRGAFGERGGNLGMLRVRLGAFPEASSPSPCPSPSPNLENLLPSDQPGTGWGTGSGLWAKPPALSDVTSGGVRSVDIVGDRRQSRPDNDNNMQGETNASHRTMLLRRHPL